MLGKRKPESATITERWAIFKPVHDRVCRELALVGYPLEIGNPINPGYKGSHYTHAIPGLPIAVSISVGISIHYYYEFDEEMQNPICISEQYPADGGETFETGNVDEAIKAFHQFVRTIIDRYPTSRIFHVLSTIGTVHYVVRENKDPQEKERNFVISAKLSRDGSEMITIAAGYIYAESLTTDPKKIREVTALLIESLTPQFLSECAKYSDYEIAQDDLAGIKFGDKLVIEGLFEQKAPQALSVIVD